MTVPHTVSPRLGCAESYTVEVWVWDRTYRPTPGEPVQPRARYVTQLTGIISIYWERTIDDFSEARIRFKPVRGDDCCAKLAPRWDNNNTLVESGIWPWSHEVVVFRDGEAVWSGPVFSYDETVNADESTSWIQINARDHLAWLDRRVIHQNMPFSDLTDLTVIAEWIILDAFGPDDLGINANITRTDSGRKGRRTTRYWEARSGDELREVARGGIDFTCVGRHVIIKGVRRDPAIGAPELRNSDFLAGVEVRIVGAEAAGVGYAVGKPPGETPAEGAEPVKVRAVAAGLEPTNGVDPFFGLIEALTHAETSDSIDFLSWMAVELVDENMPPPRTLSVPAGSTLSPEANVSVHELIPSRHFRLNIRGACAQLAQYMRLSHVEVAWEPNTPERIGVTFIPGQVEVSEVPA